MFRNLLIALAVAFFATAGHARDIQGLSAERLQAIGEQMRADVKGGRLPGVVIMVARNGKLVYSDVIGVQDPKTGAAMRADSIFRLHSMTKP